MTKATSEVVLVSMPWNSLGVPSIQLGTLKSLLAGESFRTRVLQLNLSFFEFFHSLDGESHLSVQEYEWIAEQGASGFGEWLFVHAPFRDDVDWEKEEAYYQFLRERMFHLFSEGGGVELWISKARAMRRIIPEFLEHCVDTCLEHQPKVVGFSSSFFQNIPSLILARMLKDREPELKIVLGGCNCEGTMGEALLRSYPWLNVVARGEGERIVGPLFRALVEGSRVERLPGLCLREGESITVVEEDAGHGVRMDEVPLPCFDEYFDWLPRSPLAGVVEGQLNYESSRGCWWGQKHQCTFCARRTGPLMYFRSKNADRVFDEICTLASRYQRLEIRFCDDILDLAYLKDLLPSLLEDGYDFWSFFETKSSIKKEHLSLMQRAGVERIQPGIESFSTPILKLMNKGATGLQNIRCLKWCAEVGIWAGWNLIYGFPFEDEAEYERMADLMLSLTHLQAANRCTPVRLDRYSPLHTRAESYGLDILGPYPYYRHLYGLDEETLLNLAVHLEYRHRDGRDAESYIKGCADTLTYWKSHQDANTGALQYARGPGFARISDRRTNTDNGTVILDELQAKIYITCDEGRTPQAVWQKLSDAERGEVSPREIASFLDEMVSTRLAYEEDGRYLSLAIPARRHNGGGAGRR